MEDGFYDLLEVDLGDIDEWFEQPTPGSKAGEVASAAACRAVEVEGRTAVGRVGGSGQQTPLALGERKGSVLAELPATSLKLQPGSDFMQHAGCLTMAVDNAACERAVASQSPGHSTDCTFTAAVALPRKAAAQLQGVEEQTRLQAAGSNATMDVTYDSPSKQESFSGHNSGDPRLQAAEVGFNSSEVGQHSITGNASSKKRLGLWRSAAEDKKKVTLQLTPKAADMEAAMQAAGLIPSLELVCRTKKELASVLDHLQRRWEASRPGPTWPEGRYALRLFPTAAMPILAGASWGRPDLPEALTLMDLCIAMGCPDVLPLHYGWHCISQLPATAAQSVLRLHSVQSAPERLLQGRPPQLGGKDLPLPSPSTGIGSEQTCLEQHARSPAAPSAAGAGHRQSAEITGDRQGRTMPAARAECRSAEESSLRHAAGSAGLHSRANVEGPAGSLGEQQSLPAVVQRPPVQPPSAAEQPVASSANKGSPRCEVSAQEVQSGGEVRVQQAAAPSPPQGQGGSETSIASAKHCKTPREKPCSDGQQPPQAPATWSKDQAKQLNTLAVPVARAPKAGKGKGNTVAPKRQGKRATQKRREQEMEHADKEGSKQPARKRKSLGTAVPPTSNASTADQRDLRTPESARAPAASAGRTDADSQQKQAAASASGKRGSRQTLPLPTPLEDGCSTANAAEGVAAKRSKRRHGENIAPDHAQRPFNQIGLEGHTQRAVQKLAGKSAPPAVDLLPHRSHSLDDATCDGFEAWTKFSQQKRLTEPAPTAAVAAVTDPAGLDEQDLGSLLIGDVSLSGWTADQQATVDAALALNLEWADEESLISDFPDLPLDLVF